MQEGGGIFHSTHAGGRDPAAHLTLQETSVHDNTPNDIDPPLPPPALPLSPPPSQPPEAEGVQIGLSLFLLLTLVALLLLRLASIGLCRPCRAQQRRIAPGRQVVHLLLSGAIGVGCTLAVLLLEATSNDLGSLGAAAAWGVIWPFAAFACGFEVRARRGCWRLVGPAWLALACASRATLFAMALADVPLAPIDPSAQPVANGQGKTARAISEGLLLAGSLLSLALTVQAAWRASRPLAGKLLDQPLSMGAPLLRDEAPGSSEDVAPGDEAEGAAGAGDSLS